MEGGEMTDEQINIAIAESLGWKYETRRMMGYGGMSSATAYYWTKNGSIGEIPNYTADLNACHEFEKKLSLKDRNVYTSWLYESSLNLGLATWESAHATARQRCEAYLRTIGKWIE